jgi:hypothetical protein
VLNISINENQYYFQKKSRTAVNSGSRDIDTGSKCPQYKIQVQTETDEQCSGFVGSSNFGTVLF